MSNKEIKIFGRIIVTATLLYGVFGFKCPIKTIFNIPCPGCGMTRAIKSVLYLDLKSAFYYHPLFLLVPIMMIVLVFPDKFTVKFILVFWIYVAFLFFAVYLFRLYLGIIY